MLVGFEGNALHILTGMLEKIKVLKFDNANDVRKYIDEQGYRIVAYYVRDNKHLYVLNDGWSEFEIFVMEVQV